MKTFFASTLLLFVLNTASAQMRIGIKAGLNLASIAYSDDYLDYSEQALGTDIATGMIPNYHLGGVAEFGFKGPLGLNLGLMLNAKGGSLDFDFDFFGEEIKTSGKTRPLYLEVPIALTYRNKGFFAGLGPYIGFGIGGKTKSKAEYMGQEETDSAAIEFGNDPDNSFAPLDYGAGLELGYEFNSLRLSASYNFGLANVAPKEGVDQGKDEDLDFGYYHRVIGISVAYLFAVK